MKTTIQTAITLALLATSVVHAQDAVQWKVSEGGNGHWYRMVVTPTPTLWVNAKLLAESMGGHLASIRSEGENGVCLGVCVNGPILPGGSVWLGAVQPNGEASAFAWVTGEPFDWTPGCGFSNSDSGCGLEDRLTMTSPWTGCPWNDVAACWFIPGLLVEWDADCNNDGIVDYGQCRDGSLPDDNGNNIPDSCEVPSGWIVVADSAADYATTQGVKGWHYLFDNGVGTSVVPMAYVVASGFPPFMPTWCTHPEFGVGGSYCSIDRIQCATSTPSNCSSASAGLERPHRRWINSSDVKGTVLINGYFGATDGFTTRLQLFADGVLVFEQVNSAGTTTGNLTPIGAVVEVPPTSVLDVVIDPNDGSCHADRVEYSIRMIGADCNSDGIADYGQILTAQLADANGDGIPDICQQPTCHDADLFVNGVINGADLGILLSQWGPAPTGTVSDINRDGQVNGADLGFMLSVWGACTN